MVRKLGLLLTVLASVAIADAAIAQDAGSALRAAARAMGAPDGLNSIEYSGTGWVAGVGQSYTPADDWPRREVSAYTRVIDYADRSSREEITRRQGEYGIRGGSLPVVGEEKQVFLTNGHHAWNVAGANAVPQPALAEIRQLDIWTSPHGFLQAAMEHDATATPLVLEGRKVTIVSFQIGKYRVNGTINEEDLVERVQTWVPNPVLGDMVYEHRYTDYRDFGGVKFPTVLHSHQGDPNVSPMHNWMEIRVTDAHANVDAPEFTVPDNVEEATVPPVVVESQELAPGVWWIAGGSHHSVAVEFQDFTAVVEAPQNEARSLAVIAEVQRLVPNKPISYVVNTHHHFDHSGGLRTYVATGATVVTHEGNREFYRNEFFHPGPRTLEPDLLSTQYPWYAPNRVAAIEGVRTKYVLSDGTRTMDLYAIVGLDHTPNMIVAYLPTEKILINADQYVVSTPAFRRQAPDFTIRDFAENLRRLDLDIELHVGIHGGVGSHADFLEVLEGLE